MTMNKIYKLVWNVAIGCLSVSSELARKRKTGCGARSLIIASGFIAVSDATLAEYTHEINASAVNEINCTGGDIKIGEVLVINIDIQSDGRPKNTSMTNDGKINGNVLLSGLETTLVE